MFVDLYFLVYFCFNLIVVMKNMKKTVGFHVVDLLCKLQVISAKRKKSEPSTINDAAQRGIAETHTRARCFNATLGMFTFFCRHQSLVLCLIVPFTLSRVPEQRKEKDESLSTKLKECTK